MTDITAGWQYDELERLHRAQAEVPQTWTIGLPYLTPPLTANQRLHWAARARVTSALRYATCWLARGERIPPQDHIYVALHYRAVDRRRRDADNLVPTLKPCLDGLVDAGIVPDDTPQYVTWVMPVIHEPILVLGPALWLEVTA